MEIGKKPLKNSLELSLLLQFRHKYQKMQTMSRYGLLGKFYCRFKSNLESFCIIMMCLPIYYGELFPMIVNVSTSKCPSVGSEGQKTRRAIIPVSLKAVRQSSLILERKLPFVPLHGGLQLTGWGLLTLAGRSCLLYTVYQVKWWSKHRKTRRAFGQIPGLWPGQVDMKLIIHTFFITPSKQRVVFWYLHTNSVWFTFKLTKYVEWS